VELVALLLAVGLVVRYWYLIAAVVGIFCAARLIGDGLPNWWTALTNSIAL
jgi:hypothetical protein